MNILIGCEGCATHHMRCILEKYNKGDCPCSKCIIKMICCKICDNFLAWQFTVKDPETNRFVI